MFCNKCGNILPDNAKFCTSCGAPVERGTKVNSDCDHTHGGTYTEKSFDTYATAYTSAEPTPQVGFIEAIKLFFRRYADFNGRSRRSEYWWVMLFISLFSSFLDTISGDSSLLPTLWSLGTLIPCIALAVRRLHDVGKSGLYYLWNLLPVVGQIMVLIQLVKDSAPDNQYGPNPKM